MLPEMNGLQDRGEVPDVVEAGHQAAVTRLGDPLGHEGHGPRAAGLLPWAPGTWADVQ